MPSGTDYANDNPSLGPFPSPFIPTSASSPVPVPTSVSVAVPTSESDSKIKEEEEEGGDPRPPENVAIQVSEDRISSQQREQQHLPVTHAPLRSPFTQSQNSVESECEGESEDDVQMINPPYDNVPTASSRIDRRTHSSPKWQKAPTDRFDNASRHPSYKSLSDTISSQYRSTGQYTNFTHSSSAHPFSSDVQSKEKVLIAFTFNTHLTVQF
jgi:hypothetical protein